MKIAGAVVSFEGDLTTSRYPFGVVEAYPQDDEEYRARAIELGYGTDVARMSREHEVTHHLLAKWLGLEASPTLSAIARGGMFSGWQTEETAVLAIQTLAQWFKLDLMKLAEEEDVSSRV